MSSSRSTASVVVSGDSCLREAEQAVGLAAHRRRHDDELVAGAHPFGDAARDVVDALGRAHRRAAVLVNDQCHGRRGPRCAAIENPSVKAPGKIDSSERPSALRSPRRRSAGQPARARPALAPAGASARASMPRPGTKTVAPSMQAIGPSRSARRDAARLELQLEAARRAAGAGLEALARARARAARGAAPSPAECRPRADVLRRGTRRPTRRPRARRRGADRCAVGAGIGRRRSARGKCQAASIAAQLAVPITASGAADPMRSPRRSRRSTRLAGGDVASTSRSQRSRAWRWRAIESSRHAARSRTVPPSRSLRGRGRRSRRRRPPPAARGRAAAASDASASANASASAGQTRRRRRLRAKRSFVVAVVVDPAQAMPAHIGLDRLARLVEPRPRPGDAVAANELRHRRQARDAAAAQRLQQERLGLVAPMMRQQDEVGARARAPSRAARDSARGAPRPRRSRRARCVDSTRCATNVDRQAAPRPAAQTALARGRARRRHAALSPWWTCSATTATPSAAGLRAPSRAAARSSRARR